MKDRVVECIGPFGHVAGQMELGQWVDSVRQTFGDRDQVVTLSPEHAAKLVHESWQLFHCVACGKRLNRDRLLPSGEPSMRVIGNFVRGIVGRVVQDNALTTAMQRFEYTPGYASRMRDVRLVLEWLDVSRLLKNHRDGVAVAEKLATIWTRTGDETQEDMMERLQSTGCELIRKARVRLDITCMILHRCLIEKLFAMDADLSVYFFIDSSPQRNGMELFAV